MCIERMSNIVPETWVKGMIGFQTNGRTEVREAFGYRSSYDSKLVGNTSGDKWNLTHIVGYVPFINLIVGVARFLFAQIATYHVEIEMKRRKNIPSEADTKLISMLKLQIIRGVIESLCVLGIVLLIVDVAATCWKSRQNPAHESL
ncbi:MAG: hypothetical protein H0X51_09280 [Parachlamydiaceae bacterium]|nr:hypothetical protein [Parachlamydiaceae bacterium]